MLLRFDGLGAAANDLDFGDNLAVLHSAPGQSDIFEDDADQVALYTPLAGLGLRLMLPILMRNYAPFNPPLPNPSPALPTSELIDFVAWGAAPGDDAAGLWRRDWYVDLYLGLGEASPDVLIGPNGSIGRARGATAHHPGGWSTYLPSESTPGAENALGGIGWYYPPHGALLASTTFAVSWMPVSGAAGYRFQLDDSADFVSPVISTTVLGASYVSASSVAPGTYYWRARPQFGASLGPWTAAVQIRTVALPAFLEPNGTHTVNAFKTLGIVWQLQHKDTRMLCLDGDAETGNNAWDSPHLNRGLHGRNYCARASASMLASYYGGRLSQDRITYEQFKGGPPEGDLGHDTPFEIAQTNAAMTWSIGTPITRTYGKPSFAQIKAWIDADRPIVAPIPGHVRIVDGYWEFTLGEFTFEMLHVLDPWDAAKWVNYSSDPISSYFVGPAGAAGAPNVKSDEDQDGDGVADTMDDSDGDGVVDFDERSRFATDPARPDTDGDEVPEKLDIRGYVFRTDGTYDPISPDIDYDTRRKELDRDNDTSTNDGAVDGCEDLNHNGKKDGAETSNYDPRDDTAVHVRLTWPLLGADVDLHLIQPGGAMNTYGDCYYNNRTPDWGVVGSTCDNPRLDVDCITGCTVENIRLGSPVTGTYAIKVYYYSDHGKGDTSPQVTLWLRGVPQTFGPRSLTNHEVWDVGTIQWPSLAFTPSGNVRALTAEEQAAMGKK